MEKSIIQYPKPTQKNKYRKQIFKYINVCSPSTVNCMTSLSEYWLVCLKQTTKLMESNLLTFHIKYPKRNETNDNIDESKCAQTFCGFLFARLKIHLRNEIWREKKDFYEKLLTNWLCDCVDSILLSKCVFVDFGWQLIIDQWVFFFRCTMKESCPSELFQKSGEKVITNRIRNKVIRCITSSVSPGFAWPKNQAIKCIERKNEKILNNRFTGTNKHW